MMFQRKRRFFQSSPTCSNCGLHFEEKRFSNNTNESYAFGITKLIKDRVYEAAFPLHEGECHSSDDKAPRKWLLNNWASFSTIFKKATP
ncbi:anoctamin-2-like [Tachypleus tridentatus]|uniref:anoctamin-2-like n=1 Tax=Tachypleus tridentatus TaxID=6853 RepID=UPI003FCEF494